MVRHTEKHSKNLFNPQMNILQHKQKTRIWVMPDTVPDFGIKKVESFCFHLHCIYKEKTKQLSAILKNNRKIYSARKLKFYNILEKTRIWVMAEIVPDFSMKEVESFCFHPHCICKGKTKQRSKSLFNPQMKIL